MNCYQECNANSNIINADLHSTKCFVILLVLQSFTNQHYSAVVFVLILAPGVISHLYRITKS